MRHRVHEHVDAECVTDHREQAEVVGVLILAFVGVKMLLVHTEFKIDTAVSLAVVVGLLGASVAASLLIPAKPATPREQ